MDEKTANAILDFAKEVVALLCLNGLAFTFDGSFVPFAIGADALVLGLQLKGLVTSSSK